jgi:phosphocarrier protein
MKIALQIKFLYYGISIIRLILLSEFRRSTRDNFVFMSELKTYSAELEIKNTLGLHARPAALFVQIASMYESEIYLEKDGDTVNGKSLMGLLMLAAGYGTKVKVIVTGDDAEMALRALVNLVDSQFQEE